MRRSKSLLLICAACTVFSIFTQDAAAVDLSITARAEAGLDLATRDFIDHLPTVWAPQLKTIVDDTMNRVDVSVKNYLEAINNLISDQIVDMQCHVVATEKSIVDDVVARLPWVKQSGPMETLLDQIAIYNARRQPDSSPKFIKALYNDLMLATSIVSCQNGNVPTAQVDARSIIVEYGRRWLVWNRAESLLCQTSIECPDLYEKTLAQIIRSSDQRDLTSSGGQTAFATYKKPDNRKWWERWQWWRPTADFDTIESNLSQFYTIENSIGAAKAMRELAAVQYLTAAEKWAANGKSQIDTAYTSTVQQTQFVMRMVVGDKCTFLFASAKDKLNQPATSLEQAKKDLSAALDESDIIQQDFDPQSAVIAAQVKRTTDAVTFCKGISE